VEILAKIFTTNTLIEKISMMRLSYLFNPIVIITGIVANGLTIIQCKSAQAVGFFPSYPISNFTFLNSNTNGSVNTIKANDENSISLIGGNAPSFATSGLTNYTTNAVGDGLFSFAWGYITSDAAALYDPFFVLINNVAIQLTDNSNIKNQSGFYSTNVSVGDTIGWRITTLDNDGGNAIARISLFNAPRPNPPAPNPPNTPVPEPFTIIGTLIGGTAAFRMREKLKLAANKE
jgi:hypothetical protein